MGSWCWRGLFESPLDCKEIQPVHPGDKSWMFIGRTDAEAETPILWPPHAKSWLPLGHKVGSTRCPSRLERRAESFASLRHEAWLPGWVWNANLRSLWPLASASLVYSFTYQPLCPASLLSLNLMKTTLILKSFVGVFKVLIKICHLMILCHLKTRMRVR